MLMYTCQKNQGNYYRGFDFLMLSFFSIIPIAANARLFLSTSVLHSLSSSSSLTGLALSVKIFTSQWYFTHLRGEILVAVSARGARENGGLTVEVLPDTGVHLASRYIDITIATGIGDGRNYIGR